MKKLLSFLTIFSLSASIGVQVASCDTAISPKDSAKQIINKIKEKNFDILGIKSPDVKDSNTIKSLNFDLIKNNPNLNWPDLATLTYSGGPLEEGKKVSVKVTATVSGKSSFTMLEIKWKSTKPEIPINPSNITDAQKIINKIKVTDLVLPNPIVDDITQMSTTYPKIQESILNQLKKNNSELSISELPFLSFSKVTLNSYDYQKVILTATVNNTLAHLNIYIKVAPLQSKFLLHITKWTNYATLYLNRDDLKNLVEFADTSNHFYNWVTGYYLYSYENYIYYKDTIQFLTQTPLSGDTDPVSNSKNAFQHYINSNISYSGDDLNYSTMVLPYAKNLSNNEPEYKQYSGMEIWIRGYKTFSPWSEAMEPVSFDFNVYYIY